MEWDLLSMNIKKYNIRHFWITFSFVVILVIVLFDLIIITSTDTLQIQYIPDDAYYYLTLAKNFTNFGLWTFDSGHSVTSGFHPLLAYFLAFFYWIAKPSTYEFAQFGIYFSSLITIIALLIVWKFGIKFKRPYYLIVFTLLISSKNFVYNSVSGTEWSLVILLSSLYCITLWHSFFSDRCWINATILFLLGFAGSLARSDFGLIPLFCLFYCLSLTNIDNKKNISLVAFWGFVGSGFGVLFIFLHNYIFTRTIFQSSAMMKVYWAEIYGGNYRGILSLIASILGIEIVNLQFLAYIMGVTLIAIPLIAILKKHRIILSSKEIMQELPILFAAILCCCGYLVYYSRNAAIQPWYSANLVLSFYMIILGLFIFADRIMEKKFPVRAISFVAVLIIISNIFSLFPISESNSIWPHQKFMLNAGKYLSQQEIDSKVGSWNAGIVGYYQGGSVINLDGLVNNDIYDYATSNRLPVYISENHIGYILDFENMIVEEVRRKKGGYDDMEFITNLKPVKEFGDGNYYWKHMTLYEIDP
jgi:hypothetical protein